MSLVTTHWKVLNSFPSKMNSAGNLCRLLFLREKKGVEDYTYGRL